MILLGPVLVYGLAAFGGALVPAPQPPSAPPTRSGAAGVTVLLIPGQIHYDFLLPLDARTRRDFDFAARAGVPLDHPDARWLVIGWGSRAFYTTAGEITDVPLVNVWTAATGDDAVYRIDVAGELSPGLPVRRLQLGDAQYARLLDNIRAGLAVPPARALPVPGAGLTATDAFFPARGRFDILRTCNVWVSRQLAAVGVKIGVWTPVPQSVSLSLWWFGHTGNP